MTNTIADDVAAIGRIDAVGKILQSVAQLTGMRFAAVARVTDERWTACAVRDQIDFGLEPGGELVLETTICNEIRRHHKPVVFGHASVHPQYAGHPTPRMYGFESYISIPIMRRDGTFFGTLCAIDPEPAKLDDPNIVRTLELFAELIAAQLDIEERLENTSQALDTALDTAKLREQFIAVLGHDLRNPLQAVSMGTAMLKRAPLEGMWQEQIERMQRSCSRMSDLIENILDFARGRLGSGIPVALREETDLADELRHVVSEVRTAHPAHVIEVDIVMTHPVACDRRRIAQLLTNLLVNAVTHGAAGEPVRVVVRDNVGQLELTVSNRGRAIPEQLRARLFEPFSRRVPGETAEGLGLGLYIASEIAKGHCGTLEMTSTDEGGTQFVFRMPVARARTAFA